MKPALIAVAVLAAISWGLWLLLPWLLRRRGVVVRRTRFGLALVFDSTDADGTPVRLLSVNGVYQSVCYTAPDLLWEPVCAYHRAFADVLAGTNLHRALVIGGGGYSFPKYLVAHTRRLLVDVVEIDPAITELARSHFFLDNLIEGRCGVGGGPLEGGPVEVPCDAEGVAHVEQDGRLRLVEGDGWGYLKAQEAGLYDCIVNDAFSGKRPLGPMETGEGARRVREHLAPGGIYLANVRSALEGRHAGPLRECTEAFGASFSHLYLVPDKPETPEKVGYNAFVATDRELDCSRFGGRRLR
jgi:hypothetical protein